MAKITIVGDAVIVTSELKLEDLATIKKYRREALFLRGGEDGKEPVFAIAVGASGGNGSIDSNGAVFCRANAEGKAMITLIQPGNPATVVETVADTYGGALTKLNKLEEQIATVAAEVNAEREAVRNSITVIGAAPATPAAE